MNYAQLQTFNYLESYMIRELIQLDLNKKYKTLYVNYQNNYQKQSLNVDRSRRKICLVNLFLFFYKNKMQNQNPRYS